MITCKFEKGYQACLRHVVIHALCIRANKLLLVKRSLDLPEGGKWALPGGFLDIGENVFQGVLREFQEETGWQGEVVSLFRIDSNPIRRHEDRQNVTFDFIMKPLRKVSEPDWESSAVDWWDKGSINLKDLAYDHGQILELFFKYQKQSFPLPVIV